MPVVTSPSWNLLPANTQHSEPKLMPVVTSPSWNLLPPNTHHSEPKLMPVVTSPSWNRLSMFGPPNATKDV
ncbi:hypothetical protein PoB_006135400 [Plakobranchus ocellatus]|uniref:Uncharacterized protein n=1 Tax=Plakobranchus ocellatus TaxID=259542 RepID=A0AAV4CSH7_9GAST|nr:hypothetical protein PoB_006135400 [Plakobranchus ocellatus]